MRYVHSISTSERNIIYGSKTRHSRFSFYLSRLIFSDELIMLKFGNYHVKILKPTVLASKYGLFSTNRALP